MDVVTESPYTNTYYTITRTYTETTTRTIKNNVTPTVTPTFTSSYGYYSDLALVYAYYPTGAVAESDLLPSSTYDSFASATTTTGTTDTMLYFSMPVTMTAPASCPTPCMYLVVVHFLAPFANMQFLVTVTTIASVRVPSMVTDQVTPTSVETGTIYSNRYGDVYHYETWYLSAGAAPFQTASDYYYSYYVASCSTPPVRYTTSTRSGSGSTGGSSSGGSFSSGSSSNCYAYSYYRYGGCGTPLLTWIIIIATIIPGLFVLGILESWLWFRRLMMGKSAMRFGTVCWVLISLWVLCFTRMQDKRSPEDQKLLTEKWKAMKAGAAFKAWLKWGLRHRYPEEHLGQFSKLTVGIVPPGQPIHHAMAQTAPGFPPGGPGNMQAVPGQPGQVYYYGPPPSGWAPGPNGQYAPPQGYMVPPQQHGGYYGGDAPKGGSVVGTSPVYPQAPQPVYPSTAGNVPSQGQPWRSPPATGPTSTSPAPTGAPSPPPSAAAAPQISSIDLSEAPASAAPAPPSTSNVPK